MLKMDILGCTTCYFFIQVIPVDISLKIIYASDKFLIIIKTPCRIDGAIFSNL
jgi:hypothetical protein